jgi:hypothetical protein
MGNNNKAITNQELQRLEDNTRKFIQLMKRGNYGDARLIAALLESATYTLNPVWMKGYKARQEVKA